MKIKKINIKGFGKFSDFESDFSDGLNVVYGKNETGKTTLSKFLLYSLAGFTKDEVERYRPWNGTSFGGTVYVTMDAGEDKTVELNPENPSNEKVLKRVEYEITSYIPEEGGMDITRGLDGILLAKLRKRMEEVEHMEKVVEILSNEQNIYDMLVEKERSLSAKIQDLENELNTVRAKIEEEKNLRKRYVVSKRKVKELKRKLKELNDKLLASRVLKARSIWEKMDELRMQISSLGMEISNLKKYMEKSDEDIAHIKELKSRMDAVEKELNRLNRDLEEKEKSAEVLKERIKILEKELSIETEEDAERIGLKVKNLELSLRMFQDKLKPKGFSEKWKIFKEKGDIDDRIERLKEIVENINKLEEEIKKVEGELKNIEGELRYSQLSVSTKRFLGIVFLVLAGGLVSVGLFTKLLFLLSIIASVSLGTSLAFFLSTSEYKKTRSNLENEKTKHELNKKVLEKKIEGLKSDLKKMVESMGFSSYEELVEEYRMYLRWKEEGERVKESDEVKLIEQELVKGLSEFYKTVEAPYEDLVEKLKSKVEEYTSLREKLGVLNMNIESLKGRILSTEKELDQIVDEFEKYLRKLECSEFADCDLILEKKREYEELVSKRNKLEEILQELKDKWEYYKKYHDLEIPQGVDVDNLQPEEILLSNIETTEAEIENLKTRLNELEAQLSEKTVHPEDLYKKLEELSKVKLLHEIASEAVRIFPQVIKVFQDIKNEFVEKYKFIFEEKFQKYINKIMDEPSFRLLVRDDLSIEISLIPGKMGDLESLSSATRDQLELAYKIALYETLSPTESYPFVIDNALVRYDEERLERVVELLKELSENRQIVLFTSDDRVVKLAGGKRKVKTLS